MNPQTKKQKVLDLMIQNELAVARLYQAYADKFPKDTEYWSALAGEEMRHARLIENITKNNTDSVEIRDDKFELATFGLSLTYLEEKYHQAREEDMSLQDALSTALDIETGMLEKGYFEVFEGGSAQFKSGMEALAAETNKHIEIVRHRLAKKRWRLF